MKTTQFAISNAGNFWKASNYFIGKEAQNRLSEKLSMVAASKLVPMNKVLGRGELIFKQHMFVPPCDKRRYNIMSRHE